MGALAQCWQRFAAVNDSAKWAVKPFNCRLKLRGGEGGECSQAEVQMQVQTQSKQIPKSTKSRQSQDKVKTKSRQSPQSRDKVPTKFIGGPDNVLTQYDRLSTVLFLGEFLYTSPPRWLGKCIFLLPIISPHRQHPTASYRAHQYGFQTR